MENGLVFVPESRGASNSSDKSTDDTHPSLNVILKMDFSGVSALFILGITDIKACDLLQMDSKF